jgi:hypothetical protein
VAPENDRYAWPPRTVLNAIGHPGEEIIADFFIGLADVISDMLQEPRAIPPLRLYGKTLVEVEVSGNFFPGCKDDPFILASIGVRELGPSSRSSLLPATDRAV